jgi:hypothetical protein
MLGYLEADVAAFRRSVQNRRATALRVFRDRRRAFEVVGLGDQLRCAETAGSDRAGSGVANRSLRQPQVTDLCLRGVPQRNVTGHERRRREAFCFVLRMRAVDMVKIARASDPACRPLAALIYPYRQAGCRALANALG